MSIWRVADGIAGRLKTPHFQAPSVRRFGTTGAVVVAAKAEEGTVSCGGGVDQQRLNLFRGASPQHPKWIYESPSDGSID
jgi:hypothetical protein